MDKVTIEISREAAEMISKLDARGQMPPYFEAVRACRAALNRDKRYVVKICERVYERLEGPIEIVRAEFDMTREKLECRASLASPATGSVCNMLDIACRKVLENE